MTDGGVLRGDGCVRVRREGVEKVICREAADGLVETGPWESVGLGWAAGGTAGPRKSTMAAQGATTGLEVRPGRLRGQRSHSSDSSQFLVEKVSGYQTSKDSETAGKGGVGEKLVMVNPIPSLHFQVPQILHTNAPDSKKNMRRSKKAHN